MNQPNIVSIPGLDEQSSKKIIELLKNTPEVEQIILFGSRAKGNYKNGSDIDICLVGESLTHDSITQLKLQYDLLYLPWKIDLVVLHLIQEPTLVEHIKRVGKVLNYI